MIDGELKRAIEENDCCIEAPINKAKTFTEVCSIPIPYKKEKPTSSQIERDISFLKTYVGTVQGVEMLEYYDSNFLSGNNESRCKQKIECLNLALQKIEDIIKSLKITGG